MFCGTTRPQTIASGDISPNHTIIPTTGTLLYAIQILRRLLWEKLRHRKEKMPVKKRSAAESHLFLFVPPVFLAVHLVLHSKTLYDVQEIHIVASANSKKDATKPLTLNP